MVTGYVGTLMSLFRVVRLNLIFEKVTNPSQPHLTVSHRTTTRVFFFSKYFLSSDIWIFSCTFFCLAFVLSSPSHSKPHQLYSSFSNLLDNNVNHSFEGKRVPGTLFSIRLIKLWKVTTLQNDEAIY